MPPSTTFSCWLIGADALLQECGELLLGSGHEIHGVVAPPGKVQEWARSRSLTVVDSGSEYGEVLAARPFDYLFSITHLELVPDRVLRMPARCAINFHDGPLPDFAGLNAPVWALLQRAPRYGITWHLMSPMVDAGDILVQEHFDIAADETALSLNTKCFEAALSSFAELVLGLASQSLRALPQDGARRRYFERHRRPTAACAIDWKRSAEEIEALVRALDFGRYLNPVGLPTIRKGGELVVITRARALEEGRGVATGLPATVLAVDAEGLLVATGRGAIRLEGFADLRGTALTAAEVVRRLDLGLGVTLDELAPQTAQRLSDLNQRMSRGESFWVQRLQALDPLTLPFPLAPAAKSAAARAEALEVSLPEGLRASAPALPLSTLLCAAFAAYTGRLARRTSFDIGFADSRLKQDIEGLQAWVADRLPLRVELRAEEDFSTLVARVAKSLDQIRTRGPWLRDVLARQPSLHRLREHRPAHLLPVAVEQRASFDAPKLPDGAEWTLEVCDETGACRWVYDGERIAAEQARSIQRGFEAFLASLVAKPSLELSAHALVDAHEFELQLSSWKKARAIPSREICVHHLFQEQVSRTPDAAALVHAGRQLSYAQLQARASNVAAELRELGVRPGTLVGIFVERSFDLVVAVLGVLEAGAAYLPLDPAFPPARLAFMIEDSKLGVIVAHEQLVASLPSNQARILRIDPEREVAATESRSVPDEATPSDLAYAIYTSGSTGTPKGVLIEHRQVVSFFEAIDERIPHDPPGTWLALTSLSFDISVLELLWTLTRGFKVVLASPRDDLLKHAYASHALTRDVEFSLFYFGSEAVDGGGDYRLLFEGARFADAHEFRAVWTPERHFHAFGALYPNPAVTGAAIAAITNRIEIRAGSVVLPLHHPLRVAEEWAMVDKLSNGRVAISFASGWHPEDFVLAPANHARAKQVMLENIEVVRRLWRGEAIEFAGADGAPVKVKSLPRPVRAELPVWITTAGNVATYVAAGKLGANVLTHLLGQSIEELGVKIAAYRDARAAAGLDPSQGVVSLMLHTFVGEDEARVREIVAQPLERYLESSLDLVKKYASSFPAFRPSSNGAAQHDEDLSRMQPDERAALLKHARERYYESTGLFGTPQRCLERVERLRAIGVDEIACLIDFGVAVDDVLASLPQLDLVRRRSRARTLDHQPGNEASLAELLRREHVTHLQCTPSMARILCSDPTTRRALRGVKHLFVGGEGLPAALARELSSVCGSLTNMYGPTETTIWSSTHTVDAASLDSASPSTVEIGRPLANTSFHVLDSGLQPLPIGVAGELVIGGGSVARGYLQRPALDAERFVPDPWAVTRDARMYRTGDLVRQRADGVVEFLGRTDHQIKVRGHRIEPGEIESLLARQAGVSEALVVAREDTPGDQRLIAYVVARKGQADSRLLREALTAQLPEYMVPAQLVFIDEIPRTPNGKVDRSALVDPASLRQPAAATAPSNELEARLVQLWQETLGVQQIGVESNFFDLGGHSLLAVRIHRRLAEWSESGELAAGHVSLTDLFRFPTIRSLARFLTCEVPQAGLDEASLRGKRRRASMSRRREGAREI